jgi:hypothetical protein
LTSYEYRAEPAVLGILDDRPLEEVVGGEVLRESASSGRRRLLDQVGAQPLDDGLRHLLLQGEDAKDAGLPR